MSFIEIEDAAGATVAALARGQPGELYNVADHEPVRFGEYARALAHAIGAPSPLSIPKLVALVVAPYAALVATSVEIPLSTDKAAEELAWQPHFQTYREVIARVAEVLIAESVHACMYGTVGSARRTFR